MKPEREGRGNVVNLISESYKQVMKNCKFINFL